MNKCWACGSDAITPIFRVNDVPLSSLILMETREEAVGWPKGDIELVVCSDCAFIHNRLFRPEAVDYTMPYEENQAFSPRFRAFEEELVAHLIEDYDITGKEILEIGCGKATFLATLTEAAGAKGLGIDPSFDAQRVPDKANLTGLREFFDADHTHLTGDLICCRHTLEHIQPVGEFVGLMRESAGKRDGSVVFLEVPDAERILDEGAFWDVYYEHCSYFSLVSLSNLFRARGFAIVRLTMGYDDQYLLIDARAGEPDPTVDEEAVAALVAKSERFGTAAAAEVAEWQKLIASTAAEGRKIAIWGASSKAVGFVAAVANDDAIQAAVDINPYKQDKFLPGSGHPVVGPEALVDLKPDLVVVMNPIYVDEITDSLSELGLHPEVVALGVK